MRIIYFADIYCDLGTFPDREFVSQFRIRK
jgi:hypothetical protein